MNEFNVASIISGILVTWGIGLLPPVLVRFVLLKRPICKWSAIGICGLFWVFNITLFLQRLVVGIKYTQLSRWWHLFLIGFCEKRGKSRRQNNNLSAKLSEGSLPFGGTKRETNTYHQFFNNIIML